MSDLPPDDKAALVELLRNTIRADRFLLSPRIKRLRAILDKLDPPAPKPAPLPPPKPPDVPSLLLMKKRGRRR